jgi:predicted nucleic acid-binding protein
MSRVYWDSMMFIYLQEGNPQFAPLVQIAYEALEKRNDTLCTSVFTVGEVLILPRRKRNNVLADSIRSFMLGSNIELLPFTLSTSEIYSDVRAVTTLKAADAIHLATAIECGARLFVTNDHQLQRITMPGAPLIAGLDAKVW